MRILEPLSAVIPEPFFAIEASFRGDDSGIESAGDDDRLHNGSGLENILRNTVPPCIGLNVAAVVRVEGRTLRRRDNVARIGIRHHRIDDSRVRLRFHPVEFLFQNRLNRLLNGQVDIQSVLILHRFRVAVCKRQPVASVLENVLSGGRLHLVVQNLLKSDDGDHAVLVECGEPEEVCEELVLRIVALGGFAEENSFIAEHLRLDFEADRDFIIDPGLDNCEFARLAHDRAVFPSGLEFLVHEFFIDALDWDLQTLCKEQGDFAAAHGVARNRGIDADVRTGNVSDQKIAVQVKNFAAVSNRLLDRGVFGAGFLIKFIVPFDLHIVKPVDQITAEEQKEDEKDKHAPAHGGKFCHVSPLSDLKICACRAARRIFPRRAVFPRQISGQLNADNLSGIRFAQTKPVLNDFIADFRPGTELLLAVLKVGNLALKLIDFNFSPGDSARCDFRLLRK